MTLSDDEPGGLEPIETASQDELRALQLERMRWSLRHERVFINVNGLYREFGATAVVDDIMALFAEMGELWSTG